jgi:membrane-anchored protein YejM (alkaline phosphatase superfamily)
MIKTEVYEHARARAAVRRSAAGRLWLYNVAVGCVVGTNYLAHVPGDAKAWIFALTALVSTVVFLTLAPGLLVLLVAQLVGRPRLLGVLQAALWTVFHVLLFVDTRLYNIFQYRWNGQILNLLTTRGSEDSIHLGWQVWALISLGLSGMGVVEHCLWRRALRFAVEDDRAAWRVPRILRPAAVWVAVLLPAIFVEKTLYAQAELSRDQQVKALSRLFPLYPALPFEDVASSLLGVELAVRPKVELTGVGLRYPRVFPEIDPHGPRPNILLLVVDCLRYDMVNPEVAPHMDGFAHGARAFEDHISGGNSTRFGLLSMLYGLHGSYWFPILEQGASPVLVDALLNEGYEIGVFSTASQSYPELRATAWSRVEDKVHDEFSAAEDWQRDLQSSGALIDWVEGQAGTGKPFFGFLLLDSAHQPYSHPPDALPFQPSAPEIDYLKMTRNEGPDPDTLVRVYNRYRNAVHHTDECIGDILAALDSAGLSEDTLVIVTGDHGEEFRECGFYGHTSAFTAPQVHVPLLMRGPGIEPGVERRPTSHVDLPATLLELLGADPTAREGYCLGGNLLAPLSERRRVIGGWNELGLWVPGGILRIPLSGFAFDVEVYDRGWHLITDDRAILKQEDGALQGLAEECNRFLKQGGKP